MGLSAGEGVKNSAHSLDTVGWYGRCVQDLQLVAREFRLRTKTTRSRRP